VDYQLFQVIIGILILIIIGFVIGITHLWFYKSTGWFWRGIICFVLMSFYFIPIFIAPLFFRNLYVLGAIGLAFKTQFYLAFAGMIGLLITVGVLYGLTFIMPLIPTVF